MPTTAETKASGQTTKRKAEERKGKWPRFRVYGNPVALQRHDSQTTCCQSPMGFLSFHRATCVGVVTFPTRVLLTRKWTSPKSWSLQKNKIFFVPTPIGPQTLPFGANAPMLERLLRGGLRRWAPKPTEERLTAEEDRRASRRTAAAGPARN
jgi:hypothetical protein